jgi:hypothetical protein
MYKRVVLIVAAVLLLSLTGCISNISLEEYTIEDVLEVDIKTAKLVEMAVSYTESEKEAYEIKKITGEADKIRIYEFLESAELTQDPEQEEFAVFDAIIEIKAEDYIYVVIYGNQVLVNDTKYYIADTDLGEAAKELYYSFDYEASKSD